MREANETKFANYRTKAKLPMIWPRDASLVALDVAALREQAAIYML
jgi:hypothetical protein